MKVRDIMSSPAHTIDQEASLEQAWSLMTLHGIRHLPVMQEGEMVAVLSDDDVKEAGDERGHALVKDHAHRATVSVGPDEKLPRAANLLRDHRIGCLPVLEGKKLVGIVTTADLLARMGRHAR